MHGAPPLLFHNSGRKAPGFLLFNICSGRPISQWRKAHPFLLQRREAPPFSLHHSVTRSAPFVFYHSDEGLISLSYSLTHDLIWAFLNRNMSGGTLWAFFCFCSRQTHLRITPSKPSHLLTFNSSFRTVASPELLSPSLFSPLPCFLTHYRVTDKTQLKCDTAHNIIDDMFLVVGLRD